MIRVSKLPQDLRRLNDALSLFDQAQRDLTYFRQKQTSQTQSITTTFTNQDRISNTNLTFTWTGGTTTLSWAAGFIKDKNGKVYAVPAGSRSLTASTIYWVAWNPFHKVMAFSSTGSDSLAKNKNNFLVCSLKTGTGIQTGTAGGGGSESGGSATTGNRYVLF